MFQWLLGVLTGDVDKQEEKEEAEKGVISQHVWGQCRFKRCYYGFRGVCTGNDGGAGF